MQFPIFNLVSQDKQRILPYNGLEISIDGRGQTHISAYIANGKLLGMAQYSSYEEAKAIVQEIIVRTNNPKYVYYYFPADSSLNLELL